MTDLARPPDRADAAPIPVHAAVSSLAGPRAIRVSPDVLTATDPAAALAGRWLLRHPTGTRAVYRTDHRVHSEQDSRLPQPADDVGNWLEPLGTVAICSEATVIGLSLAALRRTRLGPIHLPSKPTPGCR